MELNKLSFVDLIEMHKYAGEQALAYSELNEEEDDAHSADYVVWSNREDVLYNEIIKRFEAIDD